MSPDNERITWKWVAGISGTILFAIATAWASNTAGRLDTVTAILAQRGERITALEANYANLTIQIVEIKTMLKEALKK